MPQIFSVYDMGTVLQDRCVAHVVLVIVSFVGSRLLSDATLCVLSDLHSVHPVGLISRVSGASGIGCRCDAMRLIRPTVQCTP